MTERPRRPTHLAAMLAAAFTSLPAPRLGAPRRSTVVPNQLGMRESSRAGKKRCRVDVATTKFDEIAIARSIAKRTRKAVVRAARAS